MDVHSHWYPLRLGMGHVWMEWWAYWREEERREYTVYDHSWFIIADILYSGWLEWEWRRRGTQRIWESDSSGKECINIMETIIESEMSGELITYMICTLSIYLSIYLSICLCLYLYITVYLSVYYISPFTFVIRSSLIEIKRQTEEIIMTSFVQNNVLPFIIIYTRRSMSEWREGSIWEWNLPTVWWID